MLVALNKPFGVHCRFGGEAAAPSLTGFLPFRTVYPAGRLDADSEGLLLLTDDGALQARIAHPRAKLAKTYFAQVEGEPDAAALERLAGGLDLGDFTTLPCVAELAAEPPWLWPRHPPIRFRASRPTCWLRLQLTEGKNRQVRRMTAAVGHPTLRLIRSAIGPVDLAVLALAPGQWRVLDAAILGKATKTLSTNGGKPRYWR